MQTILIAHRKDLHNKKNVVLTRQKNNSDLQEEYLTSIYNQFLSTGLSYIRHTSKRDIAEEKRCFVCLGDAEYLSIFDLDILDYQIIMSLSDCRTDTATDRRTTPDTTPH